MAAGERSAGSCGAGQELEDAVHRRYSRGAEACDAGLCCPTSYDPRLLAAIPDEVIERDYGCGDPTRYLTPGVTVLDLGSGSGKACFIASQIVGAEGRVIGIDMNDDMLALARQSAPRVAERIGYANVEFRKGRIQDLRDDPAWRAQMIDAAVRRPVDDPRQLADEFARQRQERPLVADGSIDVVISNCVLNLVVPADKPKLFREVFRVLRPGGRAVISDIVSDREVPEYLQRDAELWSGCISGALTEDAFLSAFAEAGFSDVTILERQPEPWRVVEDIEFRSMSIAAVKGGCAARGEPRRSGCC